MNLKRKIESYQAKVGIVGLGYVGLPLATKIAEAGFQVTGYDINKENVDLVNSGNSYIPDLSCQKFMNLTKLNKIVASTNARFFSNVDIICICVPTPLNKTKTPDITHIISVSQTIAHYLQKEQIVILESTTYPGTTSEIIFPILENCPIMDRSPHDPTMVTPPHVFWDDGIWRMTYVSGIRWERVNRRLKSFYHIKSAISEDGIHWMRRGDIAVDFKNEDESNIARSAVIKEDGIYKMWYSYASRNFQYRIGYSESEDFITWHRMDNQSGISVTPGDFDSDMNCYPNVAIHEGEKYLFYNGNNFGKDGFAMAKWKKRL